MSHNQAPIAPCIPLESRNSGPPISEIGPASGQGLNELPGYYDRLPESRPPVHAVGQPTLADAYVYNATNANLGVEPEGYVGADDGMRIGEDGQLHASNAPGSYTRPNPGAVAGAPVKELPPVAPRQIAVRDLGAGATALQVSTGPTVPYQGRHRSEG